ncbi:MAG: bifunctional isocitrate dehydrogenase kinase/phosphatase [Gammaproteobacteria bacterium]|nr:bifunctional isocitrate dehydrogenase kinase/phosphatase [Gammaproteobacteria bacterium]
MTSNTARQTARAIYRNFRDYRNGFAEITLGAKKRFETGAWHEVQESVTQRLALYDTFVARASGAIAGSSLDHAAWVAVKAAYIDVIRTARDFELAETFFNSVSRNVTDDADVDDDTMFVSSAFSSPPFSAPRDVWNTYHPLGNVESMVTAVLDDFGFSVPWQDQTRDVRDIVRSIVEAHPEIGSVEGISLQILRSVFYRNKGAYLVGRLNYRDDVWPVALPVHLDVAGRIYVDTLICDEDELSVVFSFTRSYFMVHSEHPCMLIDFLQALLPDKKRSELYASVGWHKHGKTEFYRGFLQHLRETGDQFVIAPGIKGMVMSVFMLPSYQTVFKVIMDKFAPQKDITRAAVREKYVVVKTHDRVGRMADTQEFSNMSFPRDRFSTDLIEELQTVAPSAIRLTADRVIIGHLYTERLMTPLNLYIETASASEITEALDEYGNAIKELAAANIFPGDMLLKNFGVTRHKRVVFYDYDEICYLHEVNFREIPEPRTPEEEMSAEVWYTVAKNDVFPEEFRRFLFGRPGIKRQFTEMHGNLFDPAFWRYLQDQIRQGHVVDVYPYRRKRRFVRQSAGQRS